MSNTVATIRKDSPSPSEQPEATPANSSLQTIIVERRDRVGLITLNRPKSLNALNGQLAIETLAALKAFDADDQVGRALGGRRLQWGLRPRNTERHRDRSKQRKYRQESKRHRYCPISTTR